MSHTLTDAELEAKRGTHETPLGPTLEDVVSPGLLALLRGNPDKTVRVVLGFGGSKDEFAPETDGSQRGHKAEYAPIPYMEHKFGGRKNWHTETIVVKCSDILWSMEPGENGTIVSYGGGVHSQHQQERRWRPGWRWITPTNFDDNKYEGDDFSYFHQIRFVPQWDRIRLQVKANYTTYVTPERQAILDGEGGWLFSFTDRTLDWGFTPVPTYPQLTRYGTLNPSSLFLQRIGGSDSEKYRSAGFPAPEWVKDAPLCLQRAEIDMGTWAAGEVAAAGSEVPVSVDHTTEGPIWGSEIDLPEENKLNVTVSHDGDRLVAGFVVRGGQHTAEVVRHGVPSASEGSSAVGTWDDCQLAFYVDEECQVPATMQFDKRWYDDIVGVLRPGARRLWRSAPLIDESLNLASYEELLQIPRMWSYETGAYARIQAGDGTFFVLRNAKRIHRSFFWMESNENKVCEWDQAGEYQRHDNLTPEFGFGWNVEYNESGRGWGNLTAYRTAYPGRYAHGDDTDGFLMRSVYDDAPTTAFNAGGYETKYDLTQFESDWQAAAEYGLREPPTPRTTEWRKVTPYVDHAGYRKTRNWVTVPGQKSDWRMPCAAPQRAQNVDLVPVGAYHHEFRAHSCARNYFTKREGTGPQDPLVKHGTSGHAGDQIPKGTEMDLLRAVTGDPWRASGHHHNSRGAQTLIVFGLVEEDRERRVVAARVKGWYDVAERIRDDWVHRAGGDLAAWEDDDLWAATVADATVSTPWAGLGELEDFRSAFDLDRASLLVVEQESTVFRGAAAPWPVSTQVNTYGSELTAVIAEATDAFKVAYALHAEVTVSKPAEALAVRNRGAELTDDPRYGVIFGNLYIRLRGDEVAAGIGALVEELEGRLPEEGLIHYLGAVRDGGDPTGWNSYVEDKDSPISFLPWDIGRGATSDRGTPVDDAAITEPLGKIGELEALADIDDLRAHSSLLDARMSSLEDRTEALLVANVQRAALHAGTDNTQTANDALDGSKRDWTELYAAVAGQEQLTGEDVLNALTQLASDAGYTVEGHRAAGILDDCLPSLEARTVANKAVLDGLSAAGKSHTTRGVDTSDPDVVRIVGTPGHTHYVDGARVVHYWGGRTALRDTTCRDIH